MHPTSTFGLNPRSPVHLDPSTPEHSGSPRPARTPPLGGAPLAAEARARTHVAAAERGSRGEWGRAELCARARGRPSHHLKVGHPGQGGDGGRRRRVAGGCISQLYRMYMSICPEEKPNLPIVAEVSNFSFSRFLIGFLSLSPNRQQKFTSPTYQYFFLGKTCTGIIASALDCDS